VPHFYRATFCGGIYEKFKTIMWLRLHLPQAGRVAIDRSAGQLGGIPTRNCSWHSAMPKLGIPSMH